MTTLPDGRTVPPPQADERTMLESWLEMHRETLALKCADLEDAQARSASVEPSAMTLLGLVQHLAEVERTWFQRVFAGRTVEPVYPDSGTDGFGLAPERGIDQVLADWRAEVDASRMTIARASLDERGRLAPEAAALLGADQVSLRWILIHLIEEYARHNGHADLLRERIDGRTGV
ncbi:DinB family protein [Streptomyces sp. LE64]|uniref:DinB family protein n=1 Tax=Streptomyces sp. LE64 TaxID=3448653 RepID=UPI004041FF13